MNIFSAILGQILKLAPAIVVGVETMIGDSQSGASKKQMATDALSIATQAAIGDTTSAQNQQIIQVAQAVASSAIDSAVTVTKATGAYQKATAIANSTLVGLTGAAALTQVITTPVATTTTTTTSPVTTTTVVNPQPSL